MRLVFMGTPDFSAVVLERLLQDYSVCAVVTGMDKPRGRGNQVSYSPVKQLALKHGIPVLQYEKVSKEGLDDIAALAPDIVITAAFGQILSEKFLAIPKYGVLNVHASLLPKYRGASPIQWAIINGEKQTGITIMRTVKAVDAGDILLSKSTPIGDRETAGELFDRLSILGGEAIVEAIRLFESGNAVFVPQDEASATHCKTFRREDGLLDFSKSAEQIDCFIRGVTPFPSAFTYLNGAVFKVYEVEKLDNSTNARLGEVVVADKKIGMVVRVDGGAILLKTVQAENGKRMSSADYLNGHSVSVGTVLGV